MIRYRACLCLFAVLPHAAVASGFPLFDGANLGAKLMEQFSAAQEAVQRMAAQEAERQVRSQINLTNIDTIEASAAEKVVRETTVKSDLYRLKLEQASIPASDACVVYAQSKISGQSEESKQKVAAKRADYLFFNAGEYHEKIFTLISKYEEASNDEAKFAITSELKRLQRDEEKRLHSRYVEAIKHIDKSVQIASGESPSATYAARTYLSDIYPDWFIENVDVYESAISIPVGYTSPFHYSVGDVQFGDPYFMSGMEDLARIDVLSMSRELLSSTRLQTTGERISLNEYLWLTSQQEFKAAASSLWAWLTGDDSEDATIVVNGELGLRVALSSRFSSSDDMTKLFNSGSDRGGMGSNEWRKITILKSAQAFKDSITYEYEQASLLLSAVNLAVKL